MSKTDFFTYYRSVGKTPVGESLPAGRDYDFVIKKCDDNESIAIPPGALITAYVYSAFTLTFLQQIKNSYNIYVCIIHKLTQAIMHNYVSLEPQGILGKSQEVLSGKRCYEEGNHVCTSEGIQADFWQ